MQKKINASKSFDATHSQHTHTQSTHSAPDLDSSRNGKKTKSKSVGSGVVIRSPNGKIADDTPNPTNRRKQGSNHDDGKKDTKGILKKGSSSSSLGDKKSDHNGTIRDKSGQKRRVSKTAAQNRTNIKRPALKKKSIFAKLCGFGGGHVVINDPYALEAVQALNLQPWHLRKLKAQFDKIDLDGSGSIDLDEFFESVGEHRSPFTDKLFALIDLDGSGSIEFDEYVRVMATYCMFTKDEIMRFCFECFDVDRSGTIDEKEFVELCKCINNAAPTFPSNFKHALESFDVNEDGLIDYAEFLEIERRYPIILFPAFRLQDVMQKNSLGEKNWLRVIERYEHNKKVEQYKALNGGRAPPDDPLTALGKTFLPGFFRENVYIKVGASMENKHRGSVA